MIDPATRSPAPLLPTDTATSSKPTTPEQAGPSSPPESTHFSNLRQRRPKPLDIEDGGASVREGGGGRGGRGGDVSIGVSTAVAPQHRTSLQRLFGTDKFNPTTVTVTAPTYQAINRYTAGGPPGEMPKPQKFPALEANRFEFQVPTTRAAQMEAVTQLLDSAKDLGKWLQPSAASTAGAATSAEGVTASLQNIASGVGKAVATAATTAVQAVGFVARPTPLLTDMAPAEARAAAAAPSEMLSARVNEQKAFIDAAGAKYGARGIEIEVDKAMQCLVAAAGAQGPGLQKYFEEFKKLSLALHGLGTDAQAAERNAHAAALESHRNKMPRLPIDVPNHVDKALDRLDSALAGEAAALNRHKEATDMLADIQARRMGALIEQAGVMHPSLGETLGSLKGRLDARPVKADQLPRDVVLENVFNAGLVAFGQSRQQDTAQALQTLGTMDTVSLAAAAASPETRSAEETRAVALAREIAVLPRGIEMLSVMLAPQDPGVKVDKETAARRDSTLRVLFNADTVLQNTGLSPEAQKIPVDARTAAAQALERPDAKLDDLAPDLRKAFNAVRNEFFESGPGTSLQKADDYLKGLTTDMLSSVSRENSLMGSVARNLPIGGATALNPSAIASATKTLTQAGLITDTGKAVDAMKGAIEQLRSGNTATPAEVALKNMAFSLGAAVPPATPERLLGATVVQVQVPDRFGLDAATLAKHPPLQQLWADYASGNLKPAEAAHQLAKIAKNDLAELAKQAPSDDAAKLKEASDGVAKFKKAIDTAVGSTIWNRGQIDDKQQLLDGLISIGRLMSLRDKFKFTGGNSYGFDTSKVQLGLTPEGMADPASLTLRLGVAGKYQHDLVVEIGMTTQAYYLTVGTQSTVGAKVGTGAGVSLKQDFGLVSVGARVADATANASYENQWQNGLLARVPRDKTTEARNQQEFEDLLRNAVMWQEKGHAGPADAILTNVDAASLNLLGQYNRESKRGEIVGGVGPQIAISRPVQAQPSSGAALAPTAGPASAPAPGPAAQPKTDTAQVAQARAAVQLRSQGEVRHTEAEEASGHYKYQEVKEAARTLTQVGTGASLSVRLKDFGDGKTLNAGDVMGASRAADWVSGTEVTKRLVTMDGVTAPMRSRRVTEFLDLPRFEQAAEADRARWVNHGNTYTKFPKDFDPKQQSSESDFKQFFQEAARLDNQFRQYLVVDCMQVPAAAIADGYDASIQLAQKLGRQEEAAATRAERDAFLADESTWQPRRLVINNVFNTANQPGTALLGLEMRVSDNSEGAHNDMLFPRG